MMFHQRRLAPAWAGSALLMLPSLVAAQTPVERFIQRLESGETTAAPIEDGAKAAALIRQTWSECEDCDGEEFLTQALALMSEPFRKGLDAHGQEAYDDAVAIMGELRDHADPFIATHAAAYEIKSLVAQDRLVEAGDRIDEVLGEDGGRVATVEQYSYFAPELTFLRGYCLLGDLQYAEAHGALTAFLERYPDASQRLTVSAEQMLAEIETHQTGRIAEVADLMNYAGRRLAQGDTGEKVRTRQDRIVDILDELIEEAEQQEQNSSSSSSSGGGSNKPSGGNQQNQPMQQSVLPGGPGADKNLHESPRANPGEMWGQMPPAERERVLQALRDNFPARYRQLVEQYYEHLAKKP